jgi:diguanylate cyclase (GGDEF)-like protein
MLTFSFTLFMNMFIPDFKPKVFISMSFLFYIATVVMLVYKYSFSDSLFLHINIFQAFASIIIIKILYYNSIIRNFIKIHEVNALNEKLAALSITDELTKINNRRAFMNYLDIIWKQSHRLQLPINVLVIDIDYFKKYNDSLGHLEGDKALIAVAQHMKNQVKRETDFVARFGGEEFVCLLPYIKKNDAEIFARELVQSVENMNIHHPMSDHSKYLTISAGMSSIIPDGINSPAKLLDEADKALYTAKQSGRNRVVIN